MSFETTPTPSMPKPKDDVRQLWSLREKSADEALNGIQVLCAFSYGLAAAKGWHEGYHDPEMARERLPERIALIHSELSEALECYRNDDLTMRFDEETGKPEGLIVELADAIIRICDLASSIDMSRDLGAALVAKHNFNCTRPHRHGGKRC